MSKCAARPLFLMLQAALLALLPLSVAADGAQSSPLSDVRADAIRQVLERAGYIAGPPAAWGENALIIEARGTESRTIRAIVFPDAQAAATAHQQAYTQQAGGTVPMLGYSDDVGPQLLSGFGASVWRRNVALVESSPLIFAELMPVEFDCTDTAPPATPDLLRPAYHVDDEVVALVDALP
jgi:hypothetical protein